MQRDEIYYEINEREFFWFENEREQKTKIQSLLTIKSHVFKTTNEKKNDRVVEIEIQNRFCRVQISQKS